MKSTRRIKPLKLPHKKVHVHNFGDATPEGWSPCVIDQNLIFQPDALASYFFKNREPLIYDAFTIAAAVEYCDYCHARPSKGWGREFTISVPVDSPRHWGSKEVCEPLISALNKLTGDKWNIDFRERSFEFEWPAQVVLELEGYTEAILAYSDGLDSLSVSGISSHQYGDKLVRVRLGSREDSKNKPFVAVPYKVYQRGDSKESSGRSRGFKFAVLSGAASYLSGAERVIVTESGQGALGPALVPVSHASIDYRNHPVFFSQMERLFSALFEKSIHFSFPRLWNTKGETLEKYVALTHDKTDWQKTRSCWRGARQTSVEGKRRQCGICAACFLRRMSVHAAGLTEQVDTYLWHDLNAEKFEEGAAKNRDAMHDYKAHRKYAVAGMAHLKDMAKIHRRPSEKSSLELHALQLARLLGMDHDEAMRKQILLLQKHEYEWEQFLSSLDPRSFLMKWV
ncbi:MAG: 7-cyano-7-deazaguanine synthase [Sedimenticola sp.]